MGSIDDFAATPGETINYVSCHDDLCLWDKLMKSAPEATEEERIRMSQLANGIVLVSQGIPFLHGGEEFARPSRASVIPSGPVMPSISMIMRENINTRNYSVFTKV